MKTTGFRQSSLHPVAEYPNMKTKTVFPLNNYMFAYSQLFQFKIVFENMYL